MKSAPQAALTEILREQGFNVTQATVSRDIKELGLIKIPTGFNSGKYSKPGEVPLVNLHERTKRLFRDNVTGMDFSENLIIIRTLPGAAQAIASCIDHLDWKEIIGTVAGDDTIFCVVKPKDMIEAVMERFEKLMG
jgi:transcriptional regulator of arginine metabolism